MSDAARVYLYVRRGCPDCAAARAALEAAGEVVTEIEVDNPLVELGVQALNDGVVVVPMLVRVDVGIYRFVNIDETWDEVVSLVPRRSALMTMQTVSPDTSRVFDATATGQFFFAGVGGNRELPYSPGTVAYNADGSKAYRFIKQSNQVTDLAAVLGWVVCFTTSALGLLQKEATGDRDATGVDDLRPAGLVVVAIPLGNFAWVQCFGLNDVATIATSGNCIVGGNVIPHATVDGALAPALGSEATGNIVGQMLVAANSAVAAAGTIRLACPTNSTSSIA